MHKKVEVEVKVKLKEEEEDKLDEEEEEEEEEEVYKKLVELLQIQILQIQQQQDLQSIINSPGQATLKYVFPGAVRCKISPMTSAHIRQGEIHRTEVKNQ